MQTIHVKKTNSAAGPNRGELKKWKFNTYVKLFQLNNACVHAGSVENVEFVLRQLN